MQLKNLMQNDDRAVSPVIGVILMVAITVILAAVIGTFVLGLGDNIDNSVSAGVSIEGDGSDSATVTLTNKGTAESVKIVDSSNGNDVTTTTSGTLPLENTGASATIGSEGSYNVVAVGPEGEESVLRSFTVTAAAA